MDVHCTISTSCMHASLVVQSCSTLCNPLDCSLPGSSVHGTIYTGVGCHALHQGIFQTQRSTPCPTSHVSPALQADSLPAELSVQFGSAAQSCPTLWDPMNCSMPGLPVHHQHPEFTQTESVMPSNHLIPVGPFSSCPQSFPTSGSFQMSQLFASGDQSMGVSASTSVLPMNTQDWFPLGWIGWISLQSKGLSRVFSNTTVQKDQFFCAQLSL